MLFLLAALVVGLVAPIAPGSALPTAQSATHALSQRRTIDTEPLRGLRAEAATMLMQGRAAANMPVAIRIHSSYDDELGSRAVPTPTSTEAIPGGSTVGRVQVTLEAAGQPLVAGLAEDTEELRLELYLYLVSPAGAVLAHRSELLRIPVEELGESLWSTGLRIKSAVEVPAGETTFSARALLLEPERRLFAMAVEELVLGGTREQALAMPRMRDDSEWLEAGSFDTVSLDTVSLDAASPGTDSLGTGSYDPGALRPVITPGPARFELDSLAASRPAEVSYSVAIQATRLPAASESAAKNEPGPGVTVQATAATFGSAPGSSLTIDFELPKLGRGSFELTLRATDATGLTREAPPLEVWVIGDEEVAQITGGGQAPSSSAPSSSPTSAGALAWPQLLRWELDRLGDATVQADSRDAVGARALRRSYSELLAALGASQDYAAALRALRSLERAALDGEIDSKQLIRAERAIELAATSDNTAAVLPLLELRRQSYLEHRAARRYAAAGHQREMALAIARSIASDDPPEIRAAAADLLASLALVVNRYGLWPEAKRILEIAVEIDPANEPSRILISILLERQARYQDALVHTTALLTGNTQLKETRLRHAVLLRRLGHAEESRQLLRALVAEGADPSTLTVAHQELARVTELQDGPEAAASVLSTAVTRLPESAGLYLQLANTLDRSGRPQQASKVLERFLETRTGEPSPRLRYTQPPTDFEQVLDSRIGRTVTLYSAALAGAAR